MQSNLHQTTLNVVKNHLQYSRFTAKRAIKWPSRSVRPLIGRIWRQCSGLTLLSGLVAQADSGGAIVSPDGIFIVDVILMSGDPEGAEGVHATMDPDNPILTGQKPL